jgi:hypothetical protein
MTSLTERCSMEVTAKDRTAFEQAKYLIAPQTEISITFLPGWRGSDSKALRLR